MDIMWFQDEKKLPKFQINVEAAKAVKTKTKVET